MKYTTILFFIGMLLTSCTTLSYYHNVANGNTKNVQSILEKDPNLINKQNHFGNTALIISVDKRNIEMTKALIELGADVNYELKNSQTPLRIAIAHNDTDMVELLIKSDVDVNNANIYGWTPLMTAASKGYLSIVKLLVAAGADVYAKTEKEFTASAIALKKSYTNIYEYLLSLMTAEKSRDTQP